MRSPKITVMIVEDYDLARQGLSYVINAHTDFEVVCEAENGQEAISLALVHKPDIILMDIGLPELDGISATQFIKQELPQVKVAMITSISSDDEVYASLAAGADAYCLKDIKSSRLLDVLQMVYEGAIWLDPKIAKKVMAAMNHPLRSTSEITQVALPMGTKDTLNILTDRETEVLTWIVEGLSNQEIADHLGISLHTAKAHVRNIIQKLSVGDRTQAAIKALKEGLVRKD